LPSSTRSAAIPADELPLLSANDEEALQSSTAILADELPLLSAHEGDGLMPVTPVSIKASSFYCQVRGTSSVSPVAEFIRDIHPLPKAPSRSRKRKAEAAQILTSSPYKISLLEKEAKPKTLKSQPKTSKNHADNRPTSTKPARREKKQTMRKDTPRGRRPKQKTAGNTLNIQKHAEQKMLRRGPKCLFRPYDDND
jgi:hypothetical protein